MKDLISSGSLPIPNWSPKKCICSLIQFRSSISSRISNTCTWNCMVERYLFKCPSDIQMMHLCPPFPFFSVAFDFWRANNRVPGNRSSFPMPHGSSVLLFLCSQSEGVWEAKRAHEFNRLTSEQSTPNHIHIHSNVDYVVCIFGLLPIQYL